MCSNDYNYSCRGNDEGGGEVLVDDDKNKNNNNNNNNNNIIRLQKVRTNGDHNAQQI